MTTTTDIRDLDLKHFSSEKRDFDADARYPQNSRHDYEKPNGFWVSPENPELPGHGWSKFVQCDLPIRLPNLAYSSDVTICEPDRVLVIDSYEALLKLTNEFGERESDGKMHMRAFSWELLQKYYAGVLFIGEGRYYEDEDKEEQCSYSKDVKWSERLDCNSGAIWDLSVISVSESRPTGIEVDMCPCGSGKPKFSCFWDEKCEKCGALYCFRCTCK